ncbi:4Fe-4S dicluster domain-containing protein [Shewanella sp. GXUN23E]|uniref:4Fe-4S dicluster domain-containing protein n=1 Tax=Shewanella sp. GXUN23E TaxID=3422498 RepID=UPI003D7F0C89
MDKSKRFFLKGAGALLAGMCAYQATLARGSSSPITHKQYALLHDETKCIGCDACSQACRQTNQVPEGVSRLEIVRSGPHGEYPNQSYHFERHSCQHCDHAPCVKVCPTGAAYKDEQTGIVKVNDWKCVGCLYCIAACPYKVRFINPVTKAADKCDFCFESRLVNGQPPACVTACPTQALIFGDLNDQHSELYSQLRSNPVSRDKLSLGTAPKLFKIRAATGEVML